MVKLLKDEDRTVHFFLNFNKNGNAQNGGMTVGEEHKRKFCASFANAHAKGRIFIFYGQFQGN